MARILAEHEAPNPAHIDWSQYADGEWWELEQGVDFHSEPKRAYRTAWDWGKRHGMAVTGRPGEGVLQIQMRPRYS